VLLLILQIVVFASGCGAMVYFGHRLENRVAKRQRELDAQDEARRKLLYKQQKEFHRTITGTDRAVKKLADQVRGLHDDSRLHLERADALYRDFKEGVR